MGKVRMRTATVAIAVAVLLAACGGSDEAESDAITEASSAPVTTQVGAEETTPATTAIPSETSPAGADNTAVVTIGENRYEFTLEGGTANRCEHNYFGTGAIFAFGTTADLSATLSLELSPADFADLGLEPPRITVDDSSTDLDFVADPMTLLPVELGESQVDSWVIDGRFASGTATFVEENAVFAWQGGSSEKPDPVPATFEVTCAE